MLAAVVRHIGHYPIRVRGTFCGSLANADPAAEWSLVAATLVPKWLRSARAASDGWRPAISSKVAMTTALRPDELLAEARLPILPAGIRFGFAEFSRRAGDFAMAMALAVLEIEGDLIASARVGLGAAEATPRRIEAAEAVLRGEKPREPVFRAAAAAAAAAVDPLEDQQTDPRYRRELVEAMTYRALKQACA